MSQRRSAVVSTLFIILTLPSPILADQLTPSGKSTPCLLTADTHIYGPGIRLGLYLLYTSIILSWTFSLPSSLRRARITINILTLTIYINLFTTFSSPKTFILIEWYIAFLETLLLFICAFPFGTAGYRKGSMSTVFMVTMWVVVMCTEPWVFYKAWEKGNVGGVCEARIYIFVPLDLYNPTFIILGKVFAIASCMVGFFVFLYLLDWVHRNWTNQHPICDACNPKPGELPSLPLMRKATILVLGLVVGVSAIILIEKTIAANDTVFEGGIVGGAQLVFVMVGLGHVLEVVWRWARRRERPLLPFSVKHCRHEPPEEDIKGKEEEKEKGDDGKDGKKEDGGKKDEKKKDEGGKKVEKRTGVKKLAA